MVASPGHASVLQLACLLLVASSCSAKPAVDTGNLLVRYDQQKKDAVRQHINSQGYEIIRDAELAGVFTVRLKNASSPLDTTIKQVIVDIMVQF
jgi:hypothetical protein